MSKSVLIVATSHEDIGDGGKTGCWAEEIMTPIIKFQEQKMDVTLASIKGGQIPIDDASLTDDAQTADTSRFQKEDNLMSKLENSAKVDKITSGADYDAVFLPGGHGASFDLPVSEKLQKILAQAFEAGKVVAAVCHGSAGLVNVKLSDGKHLVEGKRVTGFSNNEEQIVDKVQQVPFLLETKLKQAGGLYSSDANAWTSHGVKDGKLITGQNPASTRDVVQQIMQELTGQA